MADAQFVLDTSAVLASIAGSTGSGELLGEVAEEKITFAIAGMCLIEAGLQLDEASWPMLDRVRWVSVGARLGPDAAGSKHHATAAALLGGARNGAATLLVAWDRPGMWPPETGTCAALASTQC